MSRVGERVEDTVAVVGPRDGIQEAAWHPSRRQRVFLVLTGLFIAHALLGELLGGKLLEVGGTIELAGHVFAFPTWILSIGVLPWPLVFVTTDLVNEYYGPRAVRQLTLLAVTLIAYTFVLLWACIQIPAWSESPVTDAAFNMVFGQSLWIIVGSLVAFALSQLVDALVFVALRRRTQGRLLWLRAVGSTIVSQFIDTFVINGIAFGLPGTLSMKSVVELSVTNYAFKFLIAIGTLPVIYAGHGVMERYLRGDSKEGSTEDSTGSASRT